MDAAILCGVMNNLNACIFLGFGLVMEFLPIVFPQWFPRNCIDGANTSALWLGFMGIVQGALGGFYLAWHLVQSFAVWWLTPRQVEPAAMPEPAFATREPELLRLPEPSQTPA
jgi:hypothetical protein